MAVFKEWPGIRYIMQLIIMNLVSCLACLSAIAFAQLEFSEAVTGSVSFPDGAIACIGNLAVFFTSILRGRLDLENGARDVLATYRGPKLQKINGSGLTTCDGENYKHAKVVMLSRDTSNSNSISQFMKYIRHSYGVDSILLNCLDLESAVVKAKSFGGSHGHPCKCVLKCLDLESAVVKAKPCGGSHGHHCKCVVLWTEEKEIVSIIDCRMPGTLKQLSDSVYLLPCSNCLRNGCHRCDQGLPQVKQIVKDSNVESPQIHAEESKCIRLQSTVVIKEDSKSVEIEQCDAEKTVAERRLKEEEIPRSLLTEKGFKAESPAAVCQMLHWTDFFVKKPDCICIPLCERGDDEWTKLMIRFLRSKDKVSREVIVEASDAMQTYIGRSGEISQAIMTESYSCWSLILPRLIEISLNIVLTFWLRVDALSSSLIARRVVRDHLVDSKGTGFNANAFLTSARVKCNQSSVCQVLQFRGTILGVRMLSCVVGCVNLICAMSWCVLMACNGRFGIHSMPPSKPRIVVMLASIGFALLMDFVDFLMFREAGRGSAVRILVIIFEIGYIVSGSVIVAKGMGTGKWVYSVFQALIWVKWGISSYLLGDRDDRVDSHRDDRVDSHRFGKLSHGGSVLCQFHKNLDGQFSHGIMMYSSVFMLNAILAGVRGKWEY